MDAVTGNVVHQMSALAGMTDLKHFDDELAVTNDLRTRGTDNLLAAAHAVGVRRFIAQSYTGWPNARVGGAVKSAGIWSWIHVDDAAAATAASVERGASGLYNVVDDDPAPLSEWLPYLADCVGAKPPRRVPVWLARLAVGDAAGPCPEPRGSDPP